ncbi:transcriptional repressor of cell division inhibition gene dicB [Vibrio crassostreae]|nr:transcriptional repressor of cell division inhibition gene dicB [Vibrio crassostreae]CAK2916144.1 transcriptional repressor of cell division inhibition gene dicB [Vibrio crassostreae]CAK2920668.1 transcriptional repressor of cell division inhibition gene dicB [Vibrio crassostreae]CAK2934728.1 transcriptional repressor of cell division inhibition gene dicB [Vibrio crassostreae]CAK2976319.1 transcriptional repressor of cell division inhibition gene dicB [Vibrio crassostreae]
MVNFQIMKLNEAIKKVGSKAEICRLLKVSASAVTQWGEDVPELRQYQLEVLTNGKLKSDFTKQRLRQKG